MNVIIIQEWHGVNESAKRTMDLLSRYGPESRIRNDGEYVLNPSRTVILLEAFPNTYDLLLYAYSTGRVSNKEMMKEIDIESHWGPSKPMYEKLSKFAVNNGYSLRGLDHQLPERSSLAIDFNEFVNTYRKSLKMNQELSQTFDELKYRLSFLREKEFCRNVDILRYRPNVEAAVAVTHTAHVKRVRAFLEDTQSHKVFVAPLGDEEKSIMDKMEYDVQRDFAENQRVFERIWPPLVPVVKLAPWNEVEPEWRKVV